MKTFEFHISREARDYYQFSESLFSLSGNVIFANYKAVREFTKKINQKRDLVRFPEQAVKGADINAMGLIDEILHFVVGEYRRLKRPTAMQDAETFLIEKLCKDANLSLQAANQALDLALQRFVENFPPVKVYQREMSLEAYLKESTEGIPKRQILLEEMLMLWLANVNPAFSPYLELFNDEALERETIYGSLGENKLIPIVNQYFETQPKFGPFQQNLLDMLRAPAIAFPYSLSRQLEYILTHWADIIGSHFLYRLLGGLDFIKEETRIILGVGDGGVTPIYEFGGLEKEPERFSPDRDWMPNLVMVAKHIYVWLDQLSKRYGRPIKRLDEIPEEVLQELALWGFNGLWFIGIWERSTASQKIKQWTGNPQAMASAYSLYDYQIASDLGGDEAFYTLKERSTKCGLRLGADMVPNHCGIFSKWVIEHPHWFVSLNYSPFPSYTFNSGNLSDDGRVGIYLEEHYYQRSDAAVVFKRVDHSTGSEHYIYHGNDGTSMPWNDTAQLNYLLPEVREAVIQTILQVAHRFPIIRFDAAMTLTKLHFQRLWFPEPGTGGAIPSRAEFGLTKSQVNQAMPEEFWRQVVDRVAQEIPDTLLLAEAFWLLEGFFVRTLGMHRVYNSAFMNMLRDEKNDEYRQVIKNTIEFDPEILKRYVNFMNNPDERTAVEQFGKGDKYFGISLMLATMPGLPMFGHGQIEGYAEKYGMEFPRAYWDEQPDHGLIERHLKDIAPLLHKRYIFSEVQNFLLYDLYNNSGSVDENVFAYSNRCENQRALIVYHNKYQETSGWIRSSAAYRVKGSARELTQKSLAEGLNLQNDANLFSIFRDYKSGLEFIRNNQKLHQEGLFVSLGAYQYNIFMDFREVSDNEWQHYRQIEAYLQGKGVPSVEDALKELFLQPIHAPFKELVNVGFLQWLLQHQCTPSSPQTSLGDILSEVTLKTTPLLAEIKQFTNSHSETSQIIEELRQKTYLLLYCLLITPSSPLSKEALSGLTNYLMQEGKLNQKALVTLWLWVATHALGKVVGEENHAQQSRAWMDEWLLNKRLFNTLIEFGFDEPSAWEMLGLVNILITHQDWYKEILPNQEALKEQNKLTLMKWLNDPEITRFLKVNRYQGILWYNKERLEVLLTFMLFVAFIQTFSAQEEEGIASLTPFELCYTIIQHLREAQKESAYQMEKLLESL